MIYCNKLYKSKLLLEQHDRIMHKHNLQISFFFYLIYLFIYFYFSKGKSASEIEQTSQPAGINK